MSTLAGDLARALGDVDAMGELYADDISWSLPVTLGRIGGTHEGKEAVVAFNKISLAVPDEHVRCRVLWISIDAAQRAWFQGVAYRDALQVGDTMPAFAIGQVTESRSKDLGVGDFVTGHLGCAVLTGGGAVINHGRLEPGDRLAVVGLGGVGMAALITGLAYEGVTVLAVDTLAEKRARALELGAAEALHPDEAVARGVKAGMVVEAVGHVAALECALALTAPGGRTVTVGLPAPDARLSISPVQLVADGRTLVGSYLGSSIPSRDIPVFVDMWRRGVLPIDALFSSSIDLEDINAGMDMLADGHAVRQIITFDEK